MDRAWPRSLSLLLVTVASGSLALSIVLSGSVGFLGGLAAAFGALWAVHLADQKRQAFQREQDARRVRAQTMRAARILDSALQEAEALLTSSVVTKNRLWVDSLEVPDRAIWLDLRGDIAAIPESPAWIVVNAGFLALGHLRDFGAGIWDMTTPPTSPRESRQPLSRSCATSGRRARHWPRRLTPTTSCCRTGIRCWLCGPSSKRPALRRLPPSRRRTSTCSRPTGRCCSDRPRPANMSPASPPVGSPRSAPPAPASCCGAEDRHILPMVKPRRPGCAGHRQRRHRTCRHWVACPAHSLGTAR